MPEIKFDIHLDKDKLPDRINWTAEGSEEGECKGVMISIWDGKEQNTLRMDLWTKDMRVDEMDQFFFETFMTLADTYKLSTKNDKLADKIRAFAKEFAEATDTFTP